MNCPICNGAGLIEYSNGSIMSDGRTDNNIQDCPNCKGTGSVEKVELILDNKKEKNTNHE